VDNEATGTQTYGIWLFTADNNTLRENTANENIESGIYLTRQSTDNNLMDNVANRNGLNPFASPLETSGIYGIWVDDGSNRNNLTGNEAFDNGPGDDLIIAGDNEVGVTEVEGPDSAGIYLGGLIGTPVFNNTLIDNEVRDTGALTGGDQYYGIWLTQAGENELRENKANENLLYGIWLTQEATENELIDNVALDNGNLAEGSAGIYVGGAGGSSPGGNTLVDNTVRGSEYGLWIRNSFGNTVSETLAEENDVGIELEVDSSALLLDTDGVSTEQIAPTGNTFTNDTSRNNFEWDFVTETPLFETLSTEDTDIDVSGAPVTNLDIGASTKPDTTLSFEANNISLRAADNPEPDPPGLTNIGRYFEAERTEGTTNPALVVVVSYDDADVSNVDESTVQLLRFNETAGEWQQPQPTFRALDRDDNLVAGGFSNFSNFGVFAEGGKTCIDRRNLGRGQEDQECPFDRTLERGGSRENIDRSTGRGGDDTHRDSETRRRNRGRGQGRSR